MITRHALLLALLAAPTALAAPDRTMPAPLPERPFVMPDVHTATLSNGMTVMLVENHEVPLWDLRLVLPSQPDDDPASKLGLRSATMAMLDDGAAGKDAATIAALEKKLGGGVFSGSSRDNLSVGVSGPTFNLAPLLGLWADVLLRPEFPADRWAIEQQQRVENLTATRRDGEAIAGRVVRHLTYGDAYAGRLESEATIGAITRDDLASWYAAHMVPTGAVIVAGGDLTLDTLVPLLEQHLASWKRDGAAPTVALPVTRLGEVETIFLVDRPGAAQSVLRGLLPVGTRADATWWDFFLGNTAFGGAFTARVNMNLREEKGWTYGARCGIDDGAGPSVWSCATSVQTDKTGPALAEVRKEVAEVVTTRPITADEIAFFASYRTNAFSSQYETPGALLGQLLDIWLYQLPQDWLSQWIPKVSAVTPDSANAALRAWLTPTRIQWVVVGDAEKVGPQLAALGVPVVRLDTDGNPLPAPAAPTTP